MLNYTLIWYKRYYLFHLVQKINFIFLHAFYLIFWWTLGTIQLTLNYQNLDRIRLFKFQNLIWAFKLIKMDFQEIDVLSISLENPFELICNLKSSFKIIKFDSNLKKFDFVSKFISNMDPAEWCHVGYSTLSRGKLEYTHMAPLGMGQVWKKSSKGMKIF